MPLLALAMIAGAATAAPADAARGIPALPSPNQFVHGVDNKWFPLIPGTVMVYRGEKDGMTGREVFTVTHRHRTILGILGERTAELDTHGKTTSTEGSWQANVGGARAGIYMPAHPKRGQRGRQEYFKGHAEDQYEVLSLDAHVAIPAASSHRVLLTQETTRLEPDAVDHKLYVAGIGTVVEQSIKGGNERFVLASISQR